MKYLASINEKYNECACEKTFSPLIDWNFVEEKDKYFVKKNISPRKVERPPYKQLLLEISESGYVKTGKLYGVSDNSIRKWVKMYEKHGENF